MSETPHARILVVDDEKSMREFLRIVLEKKGYEVLSAENGDEARKTLAEQSLDLVITDMKMPGSTSGMDLLRHIRETFPETYVIMITAYSDTKSAVEAMKLGARDYFAKPFNVDEILIVVRGALREKRLSEEVQILRRELGRKSGFGNMVGASPKMSKVFELIDRVAPTASTVLITGESGTGKELVAKALHGQSTRKKESFVSVNCAALPETLLESELFGHMKGSFTGAVATKRGLFEIAQGGTIFLDEIGETTQAMQVKLLRVLQERRFRRVGGAEEIKTDARVVVATNQILEEKVKAGEFREDLFYRINVIPIHLPPLRERREDIPLLADHFVKKFCREMEKESVRLSHEAIVRLSQYAWPGNVRELENVIERGVALEVSGVIHSDSLPFAASIGSDVLLDRRDDVDLPETGVDLEKRLDDLTRRYLKAALERSKGVQTDAAKLLGMTPRSFRYYARKLSLLDAPESEGK